MAKILGSQNLDFEMRTYDDVAMARRLMEGPVVRWDEDGVPSIGGKDCLHISLTWTPGYQLSDAEKITASQEALNVLKMENARAIFVARGETTS